MDPSLQSLLKEAGNLYFVCSGNIIRSSFADLLAKFHNIGNVASYGTTYHNTSIHPKSAAKLSEIGVPKDLIDSFSPTHIDDIGEFSENSVHIVMTSNHKRQLMQKGLQPERIVIIKEILAQSGDVADPYFEGNYEEAYSTISDAVLQIANLLK